MPAAAKIKLLSEAHSKQCFCQTGLKSRSLSLGSNARRKATTENRPSSKKRSAERTFRGHMITLGRNSSSSSCIFLSLNSVFLCPLSYLFCPPPLPPPLPLQHPHSYESVSRRPLSPPLSSSSYSSSSSQGRRGLDVVKRQVWSRKEECVPGAGAGPRTNVRGPSAPGRTKVRQL